MTNVGRPSERTARSQRIVERTERSLARSVAKRTAGAVSEGNHVSILSRGAEAFAAMEDAIDGAADHVHLETYIFRNDATGRSLAGKLADCARRGLGVRLIYDSLGCVDTPAALFDRLRKAGVRLLEFHPLAPWRRGGTLTRRDHRKVLVVDGRVGFTGGLNVGDEYAWGPNTNDHWRDNQFRIEGPAVADLQRLFLDMWTHGSEEEIPPGDPRLFPPLAVAGDMEVRVFGTGPLPSHRFAQLVFLHALHSAEKSIHLTYGYFVPGRKILTALRRAGERGLDVRVVLSRRSDIPFIHRAAQSTYSSLLQSGVRVYERLDRLLHAKTAVVDRRRSIVGSVNMDSLSFFANYEIGVEIFSETFGEEMEAVFDHDVERSEEIDLASWKKRPFLRKLAEKACRTLRPVM